MLRIFQKIRQRLLTENKFGKYVLYAIGEIIILIFGIVFALQVNNWNLKRQDKASEISILESMKEELQSDLEYISTDIVVHQIGIDAAQIIIDHLEKDLPYHDSLAIYFMDTSIFTVIYYNHGAYETLQSLGISLISDKKIRTQIIDLYAKYDALVRVEQINSARMIHAENFIFSSRFDELYKIKPNQPLDSDSAGEMIPLDYEGLKTDEEFKFFLKTYRNINRMNLEWFYTPQKDRISQLILSIEEELIELEK